MLVNYVQPNYALSAVSPARRTKFRDIVFGVNFAAVFRFFTVHKLPQMASQKDQSWSHQVHFDFDILSKGQEQECHQDA